MDIFNSYVSLPEGKPPFSYGFPMVFLWFSGCYMGFLIGGVWLVDLVGLHHLFTNVGSQNVPKDSAEG